MQLTAWQPIEVMMYTKCGLDGKNIFVTKIIPEIYFF